MIRSIDILGHRLVFKIAWAPDLHWDWVDKTGMTHYDVIALVIDKWSDSNGVRLTIGPLAIVAGIGRAP